MPLLDLTGIETINPSDEEVDDSQKQNQDFKGLDLTGIEKVKVAKPKPAQIAPSISTKGTKVRSGYGYRRNPITGKEEFHNGLDIPLPIGTELKPFANGIVSFAGPRKGYGNSIGIDYGNGIEVYLNHLSMIKVEKGDKVSPEAIVGLSGNSGLSTGPHTHLQVLKNGKTINPYDAFLNDPRKDGINLRLRSTSQIGEPYVVEEAQEQPQPDSAITSSDKSATSSNIPKPSQQKVLDLNGIENAGLDFSGIENVKKPEDIDVVLGKKPVLNFNPATKEDRVVPLPLLAKIATGIGSIGQQQLKANLKNPNAPGKPITLIIPTKDGKPPTYQDILEADLAHLGISELDTRFRKEKESGGDSIIQLSGLKPEKLPDGTYKVTLPFGHSSGTIDKINAYAQGGMEAYYNKQEELKSQYLAYQNDIEQQKANWKSIVNRHPYLYPYINAISKVALPLAPSLQEAASEDVLSEYEASQHGFQEAALGEVQLAHNISMLPQAFYISNRYGFHSDEYAELIRKDLKEQLPIYEAQAKIPEEEGLINKTIRGATSAVISLPRFAAFGQLGAAALPTMVYVENLHRGARNAAIAALPMALLSGTTHGLEGFINSSGNPLDLIKKSEIANRDFITSIDSDLESGNGLYLAANEVGMPLKSIDFKSITPFQRQLLIRGTNAFILTGSTALINPSKFGVKEGISQLIIGFGLPVGKFASRDLGDFVRPSIIGGDAYTLKDGSVLLKAPIDSESGLISGRIPDESPATQSSIYEDRLAPREVTTDKGEKKQLFWGNQLKKSQVEVPSSTGKAVLIDIDAAALTLIDLKRALINESYKVGIPKNTMFNRALLETQRKADLVKAITILDEAIPKETQKFFEDNELIIKEAQRTNYDSRIEKEEFIKGNKVLKKSSDKVSMEDNRPFKSESKKMTNDDMIQRMRRGLVSIEESGKKGLERNKANKGTFNSGIDPSDLPYLVRIGIGKLGRKGLDFVEFSREMIADFGDSVKPFLNEVHSQAKGFIDGVNSLANFLDTYDTGSEVKVPPFDITDSLTFNNMLHIFTGYLGQAREVDIPIDKIIATQGAVVRKKLIGIGEKVSPEILGQGSKYFGFEDVPKAVKIGDNYFIIDSHHRSSVAKLRGDISIRGEVVDFNEVVNGEIKSRQERAEEKFGEVGSQNKWFTQEKQMEVREDLLKPPSNNELQEGLTGSGKWLAKQTSNLIKVVGFYVEDAYRRGIEPKIEDILVNLRRELGDWINKVDGKDWRDIFEEAKRFYQTNNADSFFSGLKQNVLEKFPEGNIKAESAKNIIEKLGIKDELDWITGLREWIEGKIKNKERINKQELVNKIEEGQIKVEEIILGKQELTNQEKYELDNLQTRYNENPDDLNGEDLNRLADLKNKNEGVYNEPTYYDLKSYQAERLELEGGKESKEVLLQFKTNYVNEDHKALLDKWAVNPDAFTSEEAYKLREYNKDINSSVYETVHWNPYTNVFAHFRANFRTLIDGITKVFHGEEFQSDWNQAGRKQGYKANRPVNENWIVFDPRTGEEIRAFRTESEAMAFSSKTPFSDYADIDSYESGNMPDDLTGTYSKVPKNPFMENNWKELAFKRFLRMGIEKDVDGVSWTTARQQQERYGKVAESKTLIWDKVGYNKYNLVLETPEGQFSQDEFKGISIDRVRELTNEETANRILRDEKRAIGPAGGTIELKDSLKLGSGYSDYDTYFVNLAKKIAKRFGGEYRIERIETGKIDRNEISIIDNNFLRAEGQEPLTDNGFDVVNTKTGEILTSFESIVEAQNYKDSISGNKVEEVHFLSISPQMRDSILKEGQPFYGLIPAERLSQAAPTGIRNKIITRDVFDLAKNEIVTDLQSSTDNNGTVLNSGLNPDAFLDQIKLLYKGWKDFTSFSKELTKRYTDKIIPHLESIWNWLQNSKFNQDERGMLNIGSFLRRKNLADTTELKEFDESQTSLGRRISLVVHRGVALAQTYKPYSDIYDTMRSLQRVTNSYSTTILQQLTRAVKNLSSDVDSQVAKAIFTRNKEGVNDSSEDGRIISRFNLNPEQETGYNHIRGALSNVLELRKMTLLYPEYQRAAKLNDDLNAKVPGTPEHDEILVKMGELSNEIDKIETYYNSLKDSGYISLQRLGRYKATLEDPSYPIGDVNRYIVDFTKTPEEAQQRINEWKQQYNITNNGKILDAKNPDNFKEMARGLTPGEFEELVSGAGINPHSSEVEALRAEVYEKYPSMSYQLKRKFYRGYKEDNEFMLKSISHQAEVYASSYYSKVGREAGLKALEESGIEKSDPELYKVARQYIEDETSAPRFNLLDKSAYQARKFTFLMQLGYDFRQFIQNAVIQPITQNYNYLARVESPLGKRLGGLVEVEKFMINGTKLALQIGKAGVEGKFGREIQRDAAFDEFSDIYDRLKAEKVIEPEYTKSLLELEAESPIGLNSAYKSLGKRFFSKKQQEHWAGVFMRAGELATRTQMAASLFLVGKKFNLVGEELVDFIVRGVDATQTNPTRGENPLLVRRFGEAGKLFYQFKAFQHMWFENLVLNLKSDYRNQSAAATTRQLAGLLLSSGIRGLPLSSFGFLLYALATGRNPIEDFKRFIKKHLADNNYLENATLNGATGSYGFSQLGNIQAPVLDTTLVDAATQDSYIDKFFSSNVPFFMTTKQIAGGLAKIGEGGYGMIVKGRKKDFSEVLRGIEEAAPIKPIRQVLKTARVNREGYRNQAGKTLVSKSKISTTDAILQGTLGITPNIVEDKYENVKYKKLKRSKLGKIVRKLVRRAL